MGKALYESRLDAACHGVAGYIKTEYRTHYNQSEIAYMVRRDGFDATVFKITH
jgi:hypothetical protein